MTPDAREVHVERLLGRRVRDENGVVLGRIEEFLVETVDGELAVTEFHIGTAALLERTGAIFLQLPLIGALRGTATEYRIAWKLTDLSDPRRPRVRAARHELQRVPRDPSS
ncbi:MAG: hypothetical protein ABI969_05295 [bacterium]